MKILKIKGCNTCLYFHSSIVGYRCLFPGKSPRRNIKELSDMPQEWCQLEDEEEPTE